MKKLFKKVVAWILSKLWSRKEVLGENGIKEIVNRKFNFIGKTQRKNGQTMYSFNLESRLIEEVPIIKQKDGNYRGFMNPDYPSVWAMNLKNAQRKFSNHGYNELLD